MSTEIYLGEPPEHIKEWLLTHESQDITTTSETEEQINVVNLVKNISQNN